jgi:hypothetical protein
MPERLFLNVFDLVRMWDIQNEELIEQLRVVICDPKRGRPASIMPD